MSCHALAGNSNPAACRAPEQAGVSSSLPGAMYMGRDSLFQVAIAAATSPRRCGSGSFVPKCGRPGTRTPRTSPTHPRCRGGDGRPHHPQSQPPTGPVITGAITNEKPYSASMRLFSSSAWWLLLAAVVACRGAVGPSTRPEPRLAGGRYGGPVPWRPSVVRALESRCGLFGEGAERVSTSSCLTCHGKSRPVCPQRSHPVDVDYAELQQRSAAARALRPLGAVLKRGVFLPDGKIQCVTCHDGRSPWDRAVFLPPGTPPLPALDPHDPRTYESAPPAEPLPAGARVSSKPLCASCHTVGD